MLLYFNVCSIITFDQKFRFSLFFFFFFSLERFCFSGGLVVNIVAIQHFKVCLSVRLNIYLDYKSHKKLSSVMELGYVFHGNNLRSPSKIVIVC